jgi:hypothetical protein
VEATDPNGDPLFFALESSPVGMSITGSGLVEWTPNGSQLGPNDVTLMVSDGRGGHAGQGFSLTVDNTLPTRNNTSPEIISLPSLSVSVGELYAYDVHAIDAEGDLVV